MIVRDKFIEELTKKLDGIEVPSSPKAVSVEKVILFVLEALSSGNFRGIISVKIQDNEIFTPRIEQQDVLIEDKYRFLDE